MILYMKYYDLLESISNSLAKMSETTIIDNILPFLFGLVSTLIGIFVGYKISNFQENKKNMINIHFEYMKFVNILNYEINKLLSNIINIQKFSRNLLGENSNHLSVFPINNFYDVCLKLNTLRAYFNCNSAGFDVPNTNKYAQYNQIMKMINEVLEPNLFVNVYSDFEKNACNYYLLVKRNIRKEYISIIKQMQHFTTNSADGLDLEGLKKVLVDHIFSLNEIIIGKKIDRVKDAFDS